VFVVIFIRVFNQSENVLTVDESPGLKSKLAGLSITQEASCKEWKGV
jgi:hypothetical protein